MSPKFVDFWVSASAEKHMLEDHGVTAEEAREAADSTTYTAREDRASYRMGQSSPGI